LGVFAINLQAASESTETTSVPGKSESIVIKFLIEIRVKIS
jgi:hypothetical protein